MMEVHDLPLLLWSDMSSERKALLDRAYPEVLAFCRSLGLVLEVGFLSTFRASDE